MEPVQTTNFVPTTFLSIVIPVRNEEKNLPPLVEKITQALAKADFLYEVWFIDDGSTDQTFAQLEKLHYLDSRIKGAQLQRNFGKSEAYMFGFELSQGQVVATMDGDLQDDPADIWKLLEKMKEGYDLVIGWKSTGKSSASTFVLSRLFNSAIRRLTKTTLHDLNCPLRVMTNEVAKNIYIYAALHRYIPILVASQGYLVTEEKVGNFERLYGKSSYSYYKYLESLFDLLTVIFVTKYRKRPLQFLGPIGLLSLLVGFSLDAYYSVLGILGLERMKDNIASLLLGIALIMIGIQIVLTGLVGEMISRELGSGLRQKRLGIRRILD